MSCVSIYLSTLCCCCWVPSVVSDSVRPHRQQPTWAPRPWDSPAKNTGVGCHFLLQCMKVKSESEVAQLCPTLCDPMDRSPPGSSIHGTFQARGLEWGAIDFSVQHSNTQLMQGCLSACLGSSTESSALGPLCDVLKIFHLSLPPFPYQETVIWTVPPLLGC